jgi:hypothetical protein
LYQPDKRRIFYWRENRAALLAATGEEIGIETGIEAQSIGSGWRRKSAAWRDGEEMSPRHLLKRRKEAAKARRAGS